jgi:hypothetical protein
MSLLYSKKVSDHEFLIVIKEFITQKYTEDRMRTGWQTVIYQVLKNEQGQWQINHTDPLDYRTDNTHYEFLDEPPHPI